MAKTKAENIQKLLHQAWSLRFSQKIEESISLFSTIKLKIGYRGFEYFDVDHKFLNELPSHIQTSILALESSLARVQKKPLAGFAILAKAEQVYTEDRFENHFYYLFEKGIFAFAVENNWQNAMDFFLMAKSSTQDSTLQVNCLTNIVLCLENLGLPIEHTQREIHSLIKNETSPAHTVLKAYQHRELWRLGLIDQILKERKDTTEVVTQDTYFGLYVENLPYHRYYKKNFFSVEELSQASPYFYKKNFRIRTITGTLHPEDLRSKSNINSQALITYGDYAERLYLWVWKWLLHPDLLPAEKIFSVLEQIDIQHFSQTGSNDERFFLTQALSMLSLFDLSSQKYISQICTVIAPSVLSPLMEAEFLTFALLSARAQKLKHIEEDFEEQLSKLKLYQSDSFIFKDLVQRHTNERIERLTKDLNDLFGTSHIVANVKLVVDCETMSILSIKNQENLTSESLTLFFEHMKNRSSASFEEILSVCFGINDYDQVIHLTKINNLIARAKRITEPFLDIKTKLGRVIISGRWDDILIRTSVAKRRGLNSSVWRDFYLKNSSPIKSRDNWMLKHTNASKPTISVESLKEQLTRVDLEKKLLVSKSTVNRKIHEWLSLGLVQKQGQGKNTTYLIVNKDKLTKQINGSENFEENKEALR